MVRRKWRLLKATMDERARRLWAGTEADAIGWGGVAAVARATGLAISTVRKGRDEVRAGAGADGLVRVRRKGGGRRAFGVEHPDAWSKLEKLVDPVTRGDPESPLRWTCKSTHLLSREMFIRHGIRLSDKTVAKLLKEHDYSLQAPNKSVEGAQHPDRNAQFERINAKAEDGQAFPIRSRSTRAPSRRCASAAADFARRGRCDDFRRFRRHWDSCWTRAEQPTHWRAYTSSA